MHTIMSDLISQKKYLKKYLTKTTKKKKRENAPSSKRSGINLVEDDSDVHTISSGYTENDDAPVIAEITYDDEKLKLLEEFDCVKHKWKQISTSGETCTSPSKTNFVQSSPLTHLKNTSNLEPPRQKLQSTSLSDSKPEVSIPETNRQSNNIPSQILHCDLEISGKRSFASYPVKSCDVLLSKQNQNTLLAERMHQSGSSPESKRPYSGLSPVRDWPDTNSSHVRKRNLSDSSPVRKQDSDSSQKRKRHDSDSSPVRVRHDSDSTPVRKCHDSDPSPFRRHDYSSSPKRKRDDADSSPLRKRHGFDSPFVSRRHDSDSSPVRKRDDSDSSMRKRHDSDSSPVRKRHDSDSSPVRKRHDSDSSPVRKRHDSDSSPVRRRHDSDSSPVRKRHDSDSPSLRKSHDSDSSPVGKRHDSGSSPVRKKHDFDSSPVRKRHGSGSSPVRKRHDSVSSLIRKKLHSNSLKKRSSSIVSPKSATSDSLPPRNFSQQKKLVNDTVSQQNKGKDDSPSTKQTNSDASAPISMRKSDLQLKKYKSDSSAKKTRYDWDSDSSPPRNKSTCSGLPEHYHNIRANGNNNAGSSSHTTASYPFSRKSRDATPLEKKLTTQEYLKARKYNKLKTKVDVERQEREKEKEKIAQSKYDKWNKGLVQTNDYHQKLSDTAYEMSKSFARSVEDEDFNNRLKNTMREEDPMLKYIMKKKQKEGTKKLIFQGSFPPNRFNIRPGYRWDGVDRSNGFEKEFLNRQSSKVATETESYKWRIEDM